MADEEDYSQVTHLKLHLAAAHFKRIKGSFPAEAELQVAQMLCEQSNKAFPKEVDETLRIIGSYMPITATEKPIQEVRKIIDLCFDSFPLEAFENSIAAPQSECYS